MPSAFTINLKVKAFGFDSLNVLKTCYFRASSDKFAHIRRAAEYFYETVLRDIDQKCHFDDAPEPLADAAGGPAEVEFQQPVRNTSEESDRMPRPGDVSNASSFRCF